MRTLPVTLTLLFASLGGLDAEAPLHRSSAVGLNEDIEEVRELLTDPPQGELADLKNAVLERCSRPAVVLIELASDPMSLARVRILSLALLSEFPTPEVRTYLLSRVENTSLHPTFRGWALQSYARGFAATEPEQVQRTVEPYLTDLEPGLRARAEMAMEYTRQDRSGGSSDPMKPMISLLLEN